MISPYANQRLLEGGPSARGWSEQVLLGVCLQQWAFRYALRRPGHPSPALIRGSLVHTALHHHWEAVLRTRSGDIIDFATPRDSVALIAAQEDRKLQAAGHDAAWSEHIELGQRTYDLYVKKNPHAHLVPAVMAAELQQVMWCADGQMCPAPPDAEIRFHLASQKTPEAIVAFFRLGPPWLTTFRVDLLVYVGGKVYAVDWKTAWKVDKVKEQGFILSGQMLQYHMWGSVTYGDRWGGVIIGFANFAAIEGGKGEPFPSYVVPAAGAAIAKFPRAVCDRAERLARLIDEGRAFDDYPRVFSEQGPCTDRYGMCDHRRECAEGVAA